MNVEELLKYIVLEQVDSDVVKSLIDQEVKTTIFRGEEYLILFNIRLNRVGLYRWLTDYHDLVDFVVNHNLNNAIGLDYKNRTKEELTTQYLVYQGIEENTTKKELIRLLQTVCKEKLTDMLENPGKIRFMDYIPPVGRKNRPELSKAEYEMYMKIREIVDSPDYTGDVEGYYSFIGEWLEIYSDERKTIW